EGLLHERRNIVGRWRRRRAQQIVEHPLPAKHRRGSRRVRRDTEDGRLRHDAAALLAVELDTPKLLAVNAFDSVIARKRPVDERDAAVDEIQNAPVLM